MAEDTEERERLRALGKFVLQFAAVENLLMMTVWTLAKVRPKIAQALFSGLRAEGAMQHIGRILEISDTPQDKKDNYVEIFERFRKINETRNLILHYGLTAEGPEFVATNKLIALTDSRLQSVPVSTEILEQMIWDLNKILALLTLNLIDDKNQAQEIVGATFVQISQQPWLYKPPGQSQRDRKRPPSVPGQRHPRGSSPA
jgi:hypothetical protein